MSVSCTMCTVFSVCCSVHVAVSVSISAVVALTLSDDDAMLCRRALTLLQLIGRQMLKLL
jgi:hypothetical protein